MAQRVETNEGEEGMISGCSRAGSGATNDLVMVATEALVVSCHSSSLTPSRRAHEASNARDSLRLAVIAASVVVTPIASESDGKFSWGNFFGGEFLWWDFVEESLALIPSVTFPVAAGDRRRREVDN